MRRLRIYYGWVLVVGLSVVGAVNMSLGGVNFGSFIAPMRSELGISNTVFGLSSTVRTLTTGLFSPYLGRLLDKHGSQVPLALAGVSVMLLLVGLAFVQTGWQLLLLMGLLGMIGMQGGQSLYSTVPISQWFIRKRGMALSMAFVGGPIGLLLTLPGTAWLIEQYGWRATWAILGVVGGLVIVIVAVFIVRKTPESMGLLPDGLEPEVAGPAGADAPAVTVVEDEYPWTRKEATQTWAFWALGLAFGAAQLGSGTFVLFRIPYYEEQGITAAVAGLGAATDALVVVVGTLLIGAWIDRISLRHSGVLGVVLTMFALVIAIASPASVLLMFVSNFVFGLGQVFNSATRNLIWSAYYGRANIGAIRGAAFLLQMIFGAAGPPLAGALRDVSGSYELAWLAALAPMAVGSVLIFSARRPTPRPKTLAAAEAD